MLYIATGDAGDPRDAADPTSLAGKILRYRPDGSIPADNPFPNSPVYALGLRNVQGMDWHPVTRQLFVTDHGPSGFPNERFRRNNDELNAILPGKNYGWPAVAGADPDRQFVPPVTVWNPGIAPAGMAFYDGPVEKWKQHVFVSGLRGQQLRRLKLEAQREPPGFSVIKSEVLFHEKLGRIRAVVMGPDGHLYFSSSNWDGRGQPRPGDDHIYRLLLPR
jgi:glucose/arabinose dehydrogenase